MSELPAEDISFKEVLRDLSLAINDLAPVIEAAFTVGSLQDALKHIGIIDEMFSPVGGNFMKLMRIRQMLLESGYGKVKLVKPGY